MSDLGNVFSDPNMLAKMLSQLRLSATNDGPAMTGLQSLGSTYGQANAPAYGGSLGIPGTGLSLHGQYQRYPGAPPNVGVGLRYGRDF